MISLIVAVAKNNVIGNNGIIPWKIKGEQIMTRLNYEVQKNLYLGDEVL
jgi:dihydrofolate reductase